MLKDMGPNEWGWGVTFDLDNAIKSCMAPYKSTRF